MSSITTNSVAEVSAGFVMLLPTPPMKIDVRFPALVATVIAVPRLASQSYTWLLILIIITYLKVSSQTG
jgi:hypothetical protein